MSQARVIVDDLASEVRIRMKWRLVGGLRIAGSDDNRIVCWLCVACGRLKKRREKTEY